MIEQTPSAPEPTVLIAKNDPQICEAVQRVCNSVGLDLRAFDTGQALLEHTSAADHGCLVVGLRLPDMGGMQLLQKLQQRGYRSPAIIVTRHADVPSAVEAMKMGVLDFFEFPFQEHKLLEQIQGAIEFDRCARQARHTCERVGTAIGSLSPRERQVLDSLLVGMSNKQIALKLDLNEKTIASHRANLLQKVGADSLAELVQMVWPLAQVSGGFPSVSETVSCPYLGSSYCQRCPWCRATHSTAAAI